MTRTDLWKALEETQLYISKYYATALTDEDKHDQLKAYIEKFVLDNGYLVDGFTDEELVNRLYSEMVEYSILTPYLGASDIDEINVNAWDDVVLTYNKLSLARRAEKETNLKVQLLLRKDMKFLDDIQLQMSTAREFMFAYRVKNANDQSFATLNRLEKQINDQGFDCRRATKDDIKRILSRYFGHMTEDAIDDVDGERMIKKWIIPD